MYVLLWCNLPYNGMYCMNEYCDFPYIVMNMYCHLPFIMWISTVLPYIVICDLPCYWDVSMCIIICHTFWYMDVLSFVLHCDVIMFTNMHFLYLWLLTLASQGFCSVFALLYSVLTPTMWSLWTLSRATFLWCPFYGVYRPLGENSLLSSPYTFCCWCVTTWYNM